ncbi:HpcH/HpaI aldolase/citrate lyase family protein [Actinomadura algeriensis]|uniref:Citrate lyase subunit beta/citryl-CoA lyase n=1 Tax=Actinomadura algeriensis TaxID=1679523 RepID=A0ABR9K1R4_9ACTN|nr:CoA ester lyase [Actinomadura algeriensis]MBE1536476.1 citrate lyase subunit beta/citryl-CoA lyase [Actinomadura algeriensis]
MTPRTWLYVPGDRPDRIAKALGSDADTVILDLEDAVAPAAKADARRTVVDVLAGLAEGRRAYVRINAPATPEGADDVTALAASPGALAGVRIPKCEDPDELRRVADALGAPVLPVVESALGVERAFALATAHPLVAGISLGEADLSADLRAGGDALAWPRSRIVVAARAAGLPSPPQSVWTAVRDLDGLRADTRAGQRAGFFGRSVIHPAQIPVVHEACAPDPAEVAWARELTDRITGRADDRDAEAAWIDSSGRFVDKAVVERATAILEAAQAAAGTAPKEGTRS